jgi:hypothetical protein
MYRVIREFRPSGMPLMVDALVDEDGCVFDDTVRIFPIINGVVCEPLPHTADLLLHTVTERLQMQQELVELTELKQKYGQTEIDGLPEEGCP